MEINPNDMMEGELPLPRFLVKLQRFLISLVAFAMMALIFVDVFLRYVFNSPLPGAFELEQFMLALLVFLSLPIVIWADENISVALFTSLFKGTASFLLKVMTMLVNVAALGLMGGLVLRQYFSLQKSGQVTGYLEWPIFPLALAIAVLIGVSMAIQAAMLWRFLRHGNRRGSE